MPTATRKCRYCKERKRVEEMEIHNNAAFCKKGNHAVKYAIEKSAQVRKKESRRRKREFYNNDIKTRRDAAVKWFNRYIRLRDSGEPCISCGDILYGKYDAGHFITAGSCTALRFDERNCYAQCVRCNHWLSGNRVAYRENLIAKFGQELVEYLEGPQPTINITVDWYREIEETYKAKFKELESKAA